MRILQVNSARQLGGGETHVIELTGALRKRGHEVTVAGRADGPLRPDIALPFLNALDVFSASRLRSLLKRNSFDILHAHVARDYPVAAAAAWNQPVRLVLTRHLLYPIKSHRLYRRVDGWIAPTRQILETLPDPGRKPAVVIPNWVDLEKFAFRPHGVHQPVNLGLLGQIAPHKGHDSAIDSLQFLDANYRLLIAGKGDEEYVRQLQRKCRDLPVDFLGFVSLPEFFERVDILLVPSWEEPFGIVLLEAMASGIPVISTAAGGPLEIITSGVDGVLVPPRNAQALAQAVRALEKNREQIVTRARARVETNFDIRAVVPKIETFYSELLRR